MKSLIGKPVLMLTDGNHESSSTLEYGASQNNALATIPLPQPTVYISFDIVIFSFKCHCRKLEMVEEAVVQP